MVYKILIFASVFLFMTGCYDDYNNSFEEEIPTPPSTVFNTMLSGGVESEDGAALEDYSVEWSSGNIDVSEKYFITDLNQVDQLNQSLWIRKNNKIIGVGQWPLVPNDINHVTFQIFGEEKKELLAEGVALSENLTIKGVEGTGEVTYSSIDDGSDLLSYGWSNLNQLYALANTRIHMIDMPEGATVKLSIKDEFSLLKYDDDKARWIILNDDEAISGSGYYATARKQEGVIVSGKVKNGESLVSYQWYELNSERLGRSTAKGNWIQVLPASSEIIVDLVNPCQDQINTQVIYTGKELSVENLEVGDEANIQNLETEIIDCDGDLIENSAIQVTDVSGGQVLYFFGDSEVNASVSVCGMEYSIAAYDPISDETGLDFPWSTSTGDQVRYLSTCSDFVDGYSLFKVRDDVRVYNTFTYRKEGESIILSSTDGNMKLLIRGDEKGEYDVDMVNVKIYDPNFGNEGYAVSCENSSSGCGIDHCYVSHLDESNDWVRVTFAGNIWMQTIEPATAGTYQVEGIIICKAE